MLPDGSWNLIISSTRRSASSAGRRLLVGHSLDVQPAHGSPAAQRHSRISQPATSSRSCSPGTITRRAGNSSIRRYSAPSAVPLALDHAEHLQSVFAPSGHVGGLDAQIAQRPDAHGQAPPRKSIVSLLNSSNFSSCAQCPHWPNTCSCTRGICLQRHQRAVERVHPVLAAPDQQHPLAQLVDVAPHHAEFEVGARRTTFPSPGRRPATRAVLAIANRSSISSGVISFWS